MESNGLRNSFSSIRRNQYLHESDLTTYDLGIIGGGVTGCGIALDASSRGLKVLLLEKNDFASGTSSKSTKLIHGGLRYLKQLEFGLVFESGRERRVVHHLAPHLVRPEKMLLPLTVEGSLNRLSTSMGLLLYDWLANTKKTDRRQMLSASETISKEPLLAERSILGGGYYAEYRTDDARLTIELIKKAVELGANAINYSRVTDFLYSEGQITGLKFQDDINAKGHIAKCKKIISAGGPWVDQIRKLNQPIEGRRLHLTKGVHLVFKYDKLPIRQSVYFDTHDQRMVFAIPRGQVVYVGTTDTDFYDDPDNVGVSPVDRDYLIDAINSVFPSVSIVKSDVISSWAGLRPLIHEQGKAPSELSRRDEIFESDGGLISIAGGKLTGYRKMAEKVVNLAINRGQFRHASKSSETHKISLCGKCLPDNQAVNHYIHQIEERIRSLGLQSYLGSYLVQNYGLQSEWILEKLHDMEGKTPEIKLVLAEVEFAIQFECCERLIDFYIRRTGRLYFDIDSVRRTKDTVLSYFSMRCNWTENRKLHEEELLDSEILNATQIDAPPV